MTTSCFFRASLSVLLFAVTLPVSGLAQTSSFAVEVEAGPAWQTSNTVEIPNDGTASRFSLSELIGGDAVPAGRVYLTWRMTERDDLRLLVAPLSIEAMGTPEQALRFAGSNFAAGVATQATYIFNSYRLTYRRRVHSGGEFRSWIGLTAKVRDASVRLQQGATSGRKDDLGFVPLLHLATDWRPASRWSVSLDADALAGGPGRAIDASFKVGYDVGARWSLRAGYRTVEGGADVDSVYNFAWLHYGVLSVVFRP